MEIKALALTLPNPDKLFVMKSQRANNPQPILWEEKYREQLFSMQELVTSIARTSHSDELTKEQMEALVNPDLSPRKAEESVKCVWLDAITNRRTPTFLDMVEDSVTIGGLAGYDVPNGMKRVALVSNGVGAQLNRDVVTELERLSRKLWICVGKDGQEKPLSQYEPGDKVFDDIVEIDFDSLEMRSSNLFINQMTRFGDKALLGGKKVRIVTLPVEPRVSIVASKGREVLREKPRQWS